MKNYYMLPYKEAVLFTPVDKIQSETSYREVYNYRYDTYPQHSNLVTEALRNILSKLYRMF
jgi:hypothetical protein